MISNFSNQLARRAGVLGLLVLLAPVLPANGGGPSYKAAVPEWNQPVAPFRIIGNVYYVGASDVTSFLISTDQGLILIDSGFAETVPQIEANIRTLGFHLRDVHYLLNSHAHYDHAGGLAELKRVTRATVVAGAGDRLPLEEGGKHDFMWKDAYLFEPVKVDRSIEDGETVTLGTTVLTAHATPGHTKGCTTWTMQTRENGHSYDVVFLCSITAPGYKLVGNTAYPSIIDDYLHSFQRIKALPCDVLLAPHGGIFDLLGKRSRMKADAPNPFVNPGELQQYVSKTETSFREQLRKEQQDSK